MADGVAPDDEGWFDFSESLRFKLIIDNGVQYIESNIHDVPGVHGSK